MLNRSILSFDPQAMRIQRYPEQPTMMKSIRAKFAFGMKRFLCGKTVRRLARQEDGAAAVEFAMVAAPFLALVFAIIQTGLVFFTGQVLETAVADSSRLIMTGQAQTQGFNQTSFKNAVCAKIYGLFDCAGKMYVDVKTSTAFNNTNIALPVDANGNLQNNFTYQPGGPGDIVVVRLMYEWPLYTSLLGFNLSNMSGSQRLLMATAAFRNEPYQ